MFACCDVQGATLLTGGADSMSCENSKHRVHEEMSKLEEFVVLPTELARACQANDIETAQCCEAGPSR